MNFNYTLQSPWFAAPIRKQYQHNIGFSPLGKFVCLMWAHSGVTQYLAAVVYPCLFFEHQGQDSILLCHMKRPNVALVSSKEALQHLPICSGMSHVCDTAEGCALHFPECELYAIDRYQDIGTVMIFEIMARWNGKVRATMVWNGMVKIRCFFHGHLSGGKGARQYGMVKWPSARYGLNFIKTRKPLFPCTS